ncbi:HsdS Restriction endonuclease S subunits [Candidatus Nanopelagicaceae bacterium]
MSYKTTTLDTFVTLQRGFDLPAQDRIPGDIPIIAANGPVGFHNVAKVNAQCVVLGRSGSVGNPQLITGPFWPLNTTLFVKDFHGNSPTFVYYVLKTIDFKAFDAGGTVPTLNRNHLTQIEVPLLDLAHQESIGGILRNLDSKIAANNVLSRTLEDTAQTIFKSWFIDFDPVKAKMAGEKPAGMDAATTALFPDSMEESELGLIPKGWKVHSLFDCGLEIESGSRPKGGVKGITSGVPSIGAESINGLGIFDFSKTKYVPRDFYDKMNKGKPRDFDVLLYKDGGKPGEFKPRVGMFGLGFPFSEYGINEHVFILRAQEIGNPYLYFWIRLERTLDILRSRGVKAAIPGINQQDVGTIPILQPTQEVLKAFNELAMPSISMILSLANESLKLANLRDTLLPRLISGELQIPEEMVAS